MKIIYVSTVISKKKINYIINNSKNKPLQSIQKFHRLLCEGFVKNGVEVKTLSSIPMSRKISSKIIWVDKSEKENGVEYTYIPFLNIKGIRQLCTFAGITLKIIKECCKGKKEKIFICDILNTTISSTTLLLSKILKFKCIAIVTDLPRDIGGKFSISKRVNEALQKEYDGYIILTEAMNEIVNPKQKPYTVIEGLVDSSELIDKEETIKKYNEKVILYAGGLYEKYGVKALIEAFQKIKDNNTRLYLYGTGDLDDYIKNIKDSRIKFGGVVTNDVIVQEEKKATLLINPRFTNEEYTKYSFPSKNMEYMVSGTPLLTTKLPGMPKEYYEYIYCFEEETVDGMKKTIEQILNLSEDELKEKGKISKKFVLDKKNNIVQAQKIIEQMNKEIK